MASAKKIRVGIIRCDLHAMYYGALMAEHDPLLLRDPMMGQGAYFYFYTYYADPKRITVPTVHKFEIAKIWDKDRELAEVFSSVFNNKPEVCGTFEEVSDGVDLVFIADCDGDGSDHLELAIPGLKKGVPTFVDKPFAYDVKDAKTMVALAKRHKTSVMSLSMLRMVPHAAHFRNRFAELQEPEFAIIKGGGTALAGQIHAISLAQHLFGPGVDSVECMGRVPLGFMHLDYGGKAGKPPAGVVLNCDTGGTYHCAFYASAYSKWGEIHSGGIGDFEFPYGGAKILESVEKMVWTGKPHAPYEEMIECVAVATAARAAHKKRRRVCLKEFM